MKQIPNILSSLRIAMIPFFVWQMLTGNMLAAGLILLASGITDTLDGQLARHFGWVSDLGKILDPFADKLTQTAVSVCFIIRFPELWIFFAVLIFKDAIMVLLGGYLTKGGVKIEGAKWAGKVATVVFYVVMISIVLFQSIPEWFIIAMLALAVICALVAGLSYIPEFLRYMEQRKKNAAEE